MKPACTLLLRGLLTGSMLWLGACAVRAQADGTQPMPENSITLERSTCFGNCPAYRVTVTAAGQVSFTGQAHVQTMQATGQVTPTQLAAIHDALARADFDAMQASYVSRNDGCGMIMTDQPGIRITVGGPGGSRSVDFYLGCTGPAAEAVRPRIEQLANSIDQQLGTRRWIGTPKPPGAAEHVER
ncbi:DUF6438 domain-containing protein [Rhodanobacter sp. Root179]|uniref:DUF6438 domain-containing protein n=1 Tax=Rhodanobacter sp. Root179 TaxID=1736482 RepID=UPI0006F9E3A7|nr:DUF6438 domain-containing protein [Rhodanobacter sp. Root179]KRB51226.1 hypothetical protein ASD82_04025 [Rhodanobacter sp. Root179]